MSKKIKPMISLIISIIPFFLIAYYFFFLKRKSKEYSWNLIQKKSGSMCYKCSEDLSNSGQDLVSGTPTLCTSCDRDRSIKKVLNPIRVSRYKFDKFFFHKDFEKYLGGILLFVFGTLLLQIILMFLDYKSSSIPTNLLLTLYWFLLIYRLKIVLK